MLDEKDNLRNDGNYIQEQKLDTCNAPYISEPTPQLSALKQIAHMTNVTTMLNR